MSTDKILHPSYIEASRDYPTLRTCFKGQAAIKDAGSTFLPPTSGMRQDGAGKSGTTGSKVYDAYRQRAVYHSFLKDSVQSLLGTMHSKPPSFELPSNIQYLEEASNPDLEPLSLLLQRINQEQLLVGRVGLLVDVPSEGGDPYISTYLAESIIDWDSEFIGGKNKLSYVCLDESGFQRTENGWEEVESYRLLKMIGGVYQVAVTEDVTVEQEWYTPKAKGVPLTEIPFTFINVVDLAAAPDQSPLIQVADLSLSSYRQSADYYQAIYHTAQPTAVRTGCEGQGEDDKGTVMLGAGSLVDLPSGATLTYTEVSGAGIAEMREAYDATNYQASVFTQSFLRDTSTNSSGEALKVRLEAASASLKNIATTARYGLTNALRHASIFAGVQGDVVVMSNMDFTREQLVASELKILLEAKAAGAKISDAQIHRYLQNVDFTDLSLEDTLKEIEQETKSNPDFNSPE